MNDKKLLSEIRYSINLKIVGLIFLLVVGFQISLYFEPEIEGFLLSDLFDLLGPLIVSLGGFFVSKKYGFSNIFGKSYFALGLGMFFLFLGELTYMYYEYVLETDPYPSFADIFYFLMYPLLIFHLQKNIRFFNGKFSIWAKILFIAIPVITTSSYVFFSLSELESIVFDFLYGLVFVLATSITLSLAVMGGIVFRQNILLTTWILLAASIFLMTVADVWYYHIEIFGLYDYTNPVNSLWIASYCFMAYALFKYLKAI